METLRDETLFKDSQLQQCEAQLCKLRDASRSWEVQQQVQGHVSIGVCFVPELIFCDSHCKFSL